MRVPVFIFGDFRCLPALGWPISLFVCLLAHSFALVFDVGTRNFEVKSISLLWVLGVGFPLCCSLQLVCNNLLVFAFI